MNLNFLIESILFKELVICYNLQEKENQTFSNFFWNSKSKNKDWIFFAIEGKNTNGNLYIDEAIKNGYICIISSNPLTLEEKSEKYPHIVFLLVKNIDNTLNLMAQWGASQFKGTKFAITGSAGKTTTTYILTNILKNLGTVVSTTKYNSQYYLKRLCFFLYNRTENFFIAELSSDKLGFINLYGEIIKPHYSITTSIGSAHLEHFKSKENILIEKTSLFPHTSIKSFVPVIYKTKIENLENLKEFKEKIKYVEDNFEVKGDTIKFFNNIEIKNPHLKGNHNYANMNLVLHLISSFEKNMEEVLKKKIEKTLSSLTCFPGRGNIITLKRKDFSLSLIGEHHNSSYESFLKALSNIKSPTILVMGYLYELGEKTHEKIDSLLEKIEEQAYVKYVYLGDEKLWTLENLEKRKKIIEKNTNLIDFIEEKIRKEFIENIFFKGSRGSKLEKYIENIINHF